MICFAKNVVQNWMIPRSSAMYAEHRRMWMKMIPCLLTRWLSLRVLTGHFPDRHPVPLPAVQEVFRVQDSITQTLHREILHRQDLGKALTHSRARTPNKATIPSRVLILNKVLILSRISTQRVLRRCLLLPG